MSNAVSDPKVLQCFVSALKEAFYIQLGLYLEITSIEMKTKKSVAVITGATVEFSDKSRRGQIRMLFSELCLNNLFYRMAGAGVDSTPEERTAAASEMLNIFYASARKSLNESGFEFPLAIPVSIPLISVAKIEPWPQSVTMHCHTLIGDFVTEIILARAG